MTDHPGADALAAIRSLRLEVEEVDRDDTVKPTADTLPAWLAQRFDPRCPDWDALGDDDRSYWEHQARAVRRAVARGGFKTAQHAHNTADGPDVEAGEGQ
jgi:hypothetical protein